MASSSWDPGNLQINLAKVPQDIHGKISLRVDYQASQAEVYMKQNAPWTDRTGAARTGLFTGTAHELTRHVITLAHAVSYGIWLETRRDFHGRYAIVSPALSVTGEALMRSLTLLLDKT